MNHTTRARWAGVSLVALLAACSAETETEEPAAEPTETVTAQAPILAEAEDPAAMAFNAMIGTHQCVHNRTDYETREVTTSETTWTWEYDMGGYAVRDWNVPGNPSLNLRLYDPQTRLWHVWYYLAGDGYYAAEWVGGPEGDRIVLRYYDVDYHERPVDSVLEYYNISEDGFEWQSRDIYKDTGEEFEDWHIKCTKVSDG